MVTAIDGRGTQESVWRQWQAPRDWPRFSATGVQRLVVVAPHPDDEVLGAGGLMAMLAAGGTPVTVVAVTDGEASHPYSGLADLAARRTAESVAALGELGVVPGCRLRLGVPDGGVTDDADRVAEALARVLRPGDLCVATWRGDGHPDHEATGRAAAAACAASGADLAEYPVWTWHWARPGDPRVPWRRAQAVELTPDAYARKQRAIACFASQIAPVGPGPDDAAILPPHVLDRFGRDWETFLR